MREFNSAQSARDPGEVPATPAGESCGVSKRYLSKVANFRRSAMNPSEYRRLTRAVHRWLSFQQLCDRARVFSESYLTQPIAEFVSVHHNGDIQPEFTHPTFVKLGPGRPKQVDFALLTPNTRDVEAAVESKWISDAPYPKQAILNDLLRLECFRNTSARQAVRYFLVGGTREHFEACFRRLRYRYAGADHAFTTLFLSFSYKDRVKSVSVFAASAGLRKFYRKFQKDYKVALPRTFRSTLVSRSRIDNIAVYLWRIESVPHRVTFDAKLPQW